MKWLETILFSFVTSIIVTIPLAFVLTAYNLGFTDIFLKAYLTNSLIAVIVSTPASLIAAPLTVKIMRGIFPKKKQTQ
ncbi:DUF2798 domain-containing protein [Peribacillus muralis]|uniref:DUF2798 domain-containing protein n=1 Tax=Peribacillus muralis TaxID=264697 RepID=UPI00070C2E3C|nr:DUF2798 domain-containing protein [Peribacillus muralis]